MAVHPHASIEGHAVAPPSRAARVWTREEAIVEIAARPADDGGTDDGRARSPRPLRSTKRGGRRAARARIGRGGAARRIHGGSRGSLEWCDRRLLARIHRYTLNRLRAEIEAGQPGGFHAVSVRVAARRPVGPAHGPRRAADDRRGARRLRAGRERMGARRAAGAHGSIRAVDARHAVSDRRGRMGAAVGRRSRPPPRQRASLAPRPSRCFCASTAISGERCAKAAKPRDVDPQRPRRHVERRLPARSTRRLRPRGASFLRELTACAIDRAALVSARRRAGRRRTGGLRRLRRSAGDRPGLGRPAARAQRRRACGPMVAARRQSTRGVARNRRRRAGVGAAAPLRRRLPAPAVARGECRALARTGPRVPPARSPRRNPRRPIRLGDVRRAIRAGRRRGAAARDPAHPA